MRMVLNGLGQLDILYDDKNQVVPENFTKTRVMACAICRTDAKMWEQGHRDLVLPRVLGHELVVEDGAALEEALELATELSRFPQNCLRSDRLSACEQWGMSLQEALNNEYVRGLEVVQSLETLTGATSFAAGKGRHGDFEDI